MGERVLRRGLFSFLLVVAFLPSVLYCAKLYSDVMLEIRTEKTRLFGEQVLTNKELEFEYTFWESAVQGARKDRLEEAMVKWVSLMKDEKIELWGGRIDGSQHFSVESIETTDESVEVKFDDPFSVVGARIKAGTNSTVFLVPSGCSRGL